MRYIHRSALAVVGAMLLLISSPAAPATVTNYERGVEALADFQYSVALMYFTSAAREGDRNAQRNLGLMYLYGEKLYGHNVRRNLQEARHWLELAAAQGCEVSTLMLHVLKHDTV